MRSRKENNQLIVNLDGKINSQNADEVKSALLQLRKENPDCTIVFDADDLIYISSAGLRILLDTAKEQKNGLTILNVSPSVYEIFDLTGFLKIMDVRRKMREISVDGCEIIGRGAVGTVYRIDEDTIVKVYEDPDSLPMIENEQKLAKTAFLKGIPTAISYDVVKVGDKYGSVFEMLKAVTYNDLLIREPEKKEEIVRGYARFLRQIHGVEMDPGELPEAKNNFLEYLHGLRPVFPDALYDRLYTLFARMPENLHLVHGDIQMKNVMLNGEEPLLIDMDTLCVGDPVFDLMGLPLAYRLFDEDEPSNTSQFLGLSPEICSFVEEKTLEYYFEGCSREELLEAEKRILLAAYVRFLYLIATVGIGLPELKQVRIDHTLPHLQKLSEEVDSLEVSQYL